MTSAAICVDNSNCSCELHELTARCTCLLMQWRPLVRDTCFYAGSIGMMMIFIIDGQVCCTLSGNPYNISRDNFGQSLLAQRDRPHYTAAEQRDHRAGKDESSPAT